MNSRGSGAILIRVGDDHLCIVVNLGNDPDCSRLLRPHPNRMILEPAPAPQPVRKGRLRRLPGAELQKRTYVATDDDNTGETVYVRG